MARPTPPSCPGKKKAGSRSPDGGKDVACADAVNAQPIMPNSALAERDHSHHDHFTDTHPITDWKYCTDHAQKIGLGTKEYEIIEL